MGLSGITAGQARFALLKQSTAPPPFLFGGGAEYGCGDIRSLVPAAAEESCVSSVGSGAAAPAGAGQSPPRPAQGPGVQRAAPFGVSGSTALHRFAVGGEANARIQPRLREQFGNTETVRQRFPPA